MPPLVRQFPTGVAMVQPHVPWYEATVAYLLLVPAVLLWFVTVPLAVAYSECLGLTSCGTKDVLQSSTGTYGGIFWSAAVLLGLSLAAAVLVQLTVRKLHFLLVWATAALSFGLSVLAYGVLAGHVATPWGELLQGNIAIGPLPGG